MHCGSLGESETDLNETEQPHNYRTRNSVKNSDNQASTSRKVNATQAIKGAARRKMTSRQRLVRQLKEIQKMQSKTNLLIPKGPMARLVREISMRINPEISRYTVTALEALHEATEMFITQMLQDSYVLTLHRKCVTLSKADIIIIRSLKLFL